MSDILRKIEYLKCDRRTGEKLPNPAELRLRRVEAVKIYYCHNGRNAWNSTWVQKYYDDSMHLTFESAKDYAESKRVQGSVFYINEIPALQFYAGKYRVLVTQINSTCPFREYFPKARRKSAVYGKDKIENARENYLTFGAPLDGLILSFSPDSRFWVNPQPINDSIITLYTISKTKSEELKTTKLKSWQSISVGANYYLNWEKVENSLSQRSVLRISKEWRINKNAQQKGAAD